MTSKQLKFGLHRGEVEYALDEYAPQIISRMVRDVLREARPDWSTFELKIERSHIADNLYDLRLKVMGEKRG
jgi:hypothetical protein